MTGALGPGAEFDAIRALVGRWSSRAMGIGDDAAILVPTRGESLVVSVDAAVEGRHFKAAWLTPQEIGYRAVAAALSDLAAMAARPTGILIAFGLPAAWRDRLMELADGIAEAAAIADTSIVGGNLSDATELSITTTVVGEAFAPLRRSGASAGDRVYVTGRLGGPAAALREFQTGSGGGVHRARFAHPVPRLAEARWLAERGVTAGIDISDGLVADLRHLSAASGVTIDVDASAVPLVDGVSVDVALTSGEEYELVVTARNSVDVAEFSRRFGIPLTEIGVVRPPGIGGVRVDSADVAAAAGYDHLSR